MNRYFLIALCFLLSFATNAQIRLPRMVRDSMILQRNAKVALWGWAGNGEKITVTFNHKRLQTTAGADGKWNIILPPMQAGGPYTMELAAKNKIRIKDILIGDVWLCAGQSNMVHQMELHKETYADDIAGANYPQIRHFWVPNRPNLQHPEEDLPDGFWKAADPESVRQFSAVAFFFARKLYAEYKVPIGLINASVGGTPIEAWTSEEGLKEFPDIQAIIQQNKDTAFINTALRSMAAQQERLNKRNLLDKGINEPVKWFDYTYTPKGWRAINIPGYWEDQGAGSLDGVVWYRKELTVPAAMTGMAAKLYLGRIVDADFVYLNGKPIGQTGYQYPQRRYTVPAGLLQAGKNIIVVRVINQTGKGGFVPDKPYYLQAGEYKIELSGEWQYKVGTVFTPQQNSAGINIQNQPSALFNGMVAPLIPYTLKGILWYQGESNAGKPETYAHLLTNFIQDWRSHFRQNNVPFCMCSYPTLWMHLTSPKKATGPRCGRRSQKP